MTAPFAMVLSRKRRYSRPSSFRAIFVSVDKSLFSFCRHSGDLFRKFQAFMYPPSLHIDSLYLPDAPLQCLAPGKYVHALQFLPFLNHDSLSLREWFYVYLENVEV